VTVLQKKAHNPVAHLTDEDIEKLGEELDAIRLDVLSSLGERDADYIRAVIDTQRKLELGSRALLLVSLFPPAWLLGTAGLSVSKILENMEIGHNVMHGQWDWMRDPKIHSMTWEWDIAIPAVQWKHSHNEIHHKYANVIGKDDDVGYGMLRMDEDQEWSPARLPQLFYNVLLALGFEYGIAFREIEFKAVREGEKDAEELKREIRQVFTKIRKQGTKDYVVHPVLSGPSAPATLAANVIANMVRNVWTHTVIFCGHFPDGVETFDEASVDGETRGQWYLRQMQGSANLEGGPLLHIMTGNLSFQIEHHLFPDMASNRYQEIAPKVRELCQRYGIPYTTGPMHHQVGSAWKKVARLSLPNQFFHPRSWLPGQPSQVSVDAA
jgi:fatty acid desaturase